MTADLHMRVERPETTAEWSFLFALGLIVLLFYAGLTWLPPLAGGVGSRQAIYPLAVQLAFVALPVGLEMILFHQRVAGSLREIGLSRFSWTGIRIAAAYLVPMMLFFPVVSAVTGAPLAVRPDWPGLLARIVVVNGLAEEVMMRGFIFRHLRSGRPFWRAAWLATAFFAAYHLPLILTAGVLVGAMGVVIAIPIGLLAACIYERGDNTIWGPALMHAGNNALAMLFTVRAELQPTVTALYLLLGTVVSLAIVVSAHRAGAGSSRVRS